ncbi:unnamed protein product [Aphanomyces euteiches]|uniref:Uncharacterized protein n=1 Tax=Aphanomyces euteiches TaxID=100861 RepID=A0A6G0WXG8_9STRA|nr:hypothetical protein Ae201684_010552 [Aphanomyces euteiches]KAH9090180.1 hypothetical protein Ae201684P_014929 [Aphanomyces euteiches]KAH9142084.1 hypothetical protein AeRB84_013816 [Aphanomyces euteiches]
MTESPTTQPPSEARQIFLGVLLILVINVVLPIVIFNILSPHMDDVYALLLSGVPPMMETLFRIIVQRRFDVINILAVISIGLSVALALATKDAKLAMVKDSFFTFLFGLAYWLSTYFGRENLTWYYYRQLRGPAAKEALDAMYAIEGVRRTLNFICRVWGSAMVVEALVRVALIYILSVHTMVYVSPALVWSTFVGLGIWNSWYVRYVRRKYATRTNEETVTTQVDEANPDPQVTMAEELETPKTEKIAMP